MLLGVLALGAAAGCDPEATDIGKPCEQKSDCVGTLICDVHDGRGSCQEDHQHQEPDTIGVKWIEVAANNYKLDLEPAFDPATTEYEAMAEGSGIVVWADVILTGDASAVTVNGEPAELIGFRTWRNTESTSLVSPTTITVEVEPPEGGDVTEALYDIDVTTP